MRQIKKIGWFPAAFAGTALIILLASGAWPQEPAAGKPLAKNLPEGLRHVPPEAMAFAYFRCGDFLKSDLGKMLRQKLAGDPETGGVLKNLHRELGVSLADLESVTVVLLEPPLDGLRPPMPFEKGPRFFDKKPTAPLSAPPFEGKKGAASKPPEFPQKDIPKPDVKPEDKDVFDSAGLSPVAFQPDAMPPFEDHMDVIGHRTLFSPLLIVTTSKPLNRKKLLARLVAPERLGHEHVPMLFLSDRSFLIGESRSLLQFADSAPARPKGSGFTPVQPLKAALAQGKENHVLVAGFQLPAALKKLLLSRLPGQHPDPHVTFFPLINVAWAAVTLDLANGADLNIQLQGRDERNASLSAEAAKAGLSLLELGLDKLGREKGEEGLAAKSWFKPLQETLAKATVRREGSLVRLRLQADLEPKVIAAAVGEIADLVRLAGGRTQSINNLKQIALAMLNHESAYRGFPPPALTDKNGKPLLSWRVAILPYIEQENLYRQFQLDQPWDSEHNKKLIAQMPPIYADPRGKKSAEPGLTYYQVFVGPGTAFEPLNKFGQLANIRMSQILDGTSNTLMAVEAANPVIWTKPDDLPFDPKKPLPKLGGLFPEGFHAALCDGSVRFIRRSVPEATLRLLIIRNDGMPIPPY